MCQQDTPREYVSAPSTPPHPSTAPREEVSRPSTAPREEVSRPSTAPREEVSRPSTAPREEVSRPSTAPREEIPCTSAMPKQQKKRKKSDESCLHETSASPEPDRSSHKRRMVGETNYRSNLRKAWKIKSRLSFEQYLMKCGEEGRLYGSLKQKYDQMIKDQMIKDQPMEELDIVHSKTPPPTLDSSSGDTDLDADSSVLHIDLNVDTGSALVSMDRHSQSRSPSPEDKSMAEKGETIPQEKPPVAPVAVEGNATMNSPTQAVAKPLTPDSEEVAKAVAALLSDEEVPAEGM